MNRLILLILYTIGLTCSALAAGSPFSPGAAGMGGGYGGSRDPSSDRAFSMRSEYAALWRDMKSTLENLRRTLGATNSQVAALVTQIQTNAEFLDARWEVWFGHNLPGRYGSNDSYLRCLLAEDKQMGKLNKEPDPNRVLDTLQNIAMDLQVKADNCRQSADGLGKDIKVKVRTKADEKEIAGFEVFYVPRGMLDVKSAHERFLRLSSPTDEQILSPGRYAMWVRRKGITSEPITLSVGGHGETHVDIELVVPAN